MSPTRRRGLNQAFALVALIAASSSAGAVAPTDACHANRSATVDPLALYGAEAEYAVLRDGAPIGRHTLRFERNGDALSVSVRSDLVVRVLGVPVYRFAYDATEQWRGGCLVALRAVADDDGNRTETSATLAHEGLSISGPKGSAIAPRGVFATNHWHSGVLATSQVVNTLTGTVDRVTISGAGSIPRPVNGIERAVRVYDYSGDIDNHVWYDAEGRWVGMTFPGKDGSKIEFVCVRCKGDSRRVAMTSPVVWCTGAGKGIGRAVTLEYARRDHVVAASARTAADLDTLVADSKQLPGPVHPVPLDVTDPAATEATVAAIEQHLGPIGLAILNAGTHQEMFARDFRAETVRALIETNLMGTVHGFAALLPPMMARRSGHIAVVASVAGYCGLPSSAAYGATKAALINMCEALKPDLERYGVRVSVINPGFVRTPLTDRNAFPMPFLIEADEAARRIVDGLASGRFEIAFPRRMRWSMKLLRALPYPLFFAVTRRLLRD